MIFPGPAELAFGMVSLLILVFVALWLFRGAFSSPRSRSPAVRLLEERYARGEISREEFEERRAVLEGRQRQPEP